MTLALAVEMLDRPPQRAAALRRLVLQTPYKLKFALGRLAYGSFVSLRRRYAYLETPKAASTSIKQMISALEGAPVDAALPPSQRETRTEMLVHQRDRLAVPSLLDIDAELASAVVTGNAGFLTFAVVRNPYSRLVSVFESKFRLCEPGYAELGRRWTDTGPFGSVTAAFADFAETVLEREQLHERDDHLRPQGRLILKDLVRYSHIFRLENPERIAVALGDHLQRGERRPSLPSLNGRAGQGWKAYYTEKVARRVAEVYAEDFEAFGYGLDSWRGVNDAPLVEGEQAARWRREIAARNAMIADLYDRLGVA